MPDNSATSEAKGRRATGPSWRRLATDLLILLTILVGAGYAVSVDAGTVEDVRPAVSIVP
ncbi:MAG: hypothetical protein WBF53_11885 [Litorimonas sp.]